MNIAAFTAASILVITGWAIAPAAMAQPFPVKPVKAVLPYPPGGFDLVVRILAPKIGEDLGQNLIIENRPGAAAQIGTAFVAKAPPDGYTLLYVSPGPFAVAPSMAGKLPYDPFKDFTAITRSHEAVQLILVSTATPVGSIAELIDYAKRFPGKLSVGSPGIGSPNHIDAEMFKSISNTNLVHVPYKGAGPLLTAILTNEIQLVFLAYQAVKPHLGSGKLKPLATNGSRSDLVPALTPASELIPGYRRVPVWGGWFGPAGLPRPILNRLHSAIVKASRDPEMINRLSQDGITLLSDTPEEFAAAVKEDVERIGKLFATYSITPE